MKRTIKIFGIFAVLKSNMMKLVFVVAAITFFLSPVLFAQSELMIKKSDRAFYLEHQVVPGENFYSVGRLFNVHPKELATFNNLDMTKGLFIGQDLRIPLTQKNYSQSSNKKGLPVLYTVEEKEGLNRVSANNNKVSLSNIRKWNHLANDNVSAGSNLVVGWLVGGALKIPVVKNDVKNDLKSDVKSDVKKEGKADSKSLVKKDEGVKTIPEHKDPEPVVIKEDTRPLVQEAKKIELVKENKTSPSEAGYFRSFFELQTRNYPVSKDLTVTSGIFKTSSGWQDAKYYALIDKVEPGTIIRIINPINNKMVYAKVLGEMSGIRQNAGLNIRISNAAASALDVNEPDKFIVKVNY